MELSNVNSITMTNPVFDDNERNRWLNNPAACVDSRFKAVLRIDPLLRNFPLAAKRLSELGYAVSEDIGDKAIEEARRFLRDWIDRQKAIYLAVSLLYKWDHRRAVMGKVLVDKYSDPMSMGYRLTNEHIQRDIKAFFARTFSAFLAQ